MQDLFWSNTKTFNSQRWEQRGKRRQERSKARRKQQWDHFNVRCFTLWFYKVRASPYTKIAKVSLYRSHKYDLFILKRMEWKPFQMLHCRWRWGKFKIRKWRKEHNILIKLPSNAAKCMHFKDFSVIYVKRHTNKVIKSKWKREETWTAVWVHLCKHFDVLIYPVLIKYSSFNNINLPHMFRDFSLQCGLFPKII